MKCAFNVASDSVKAEDVILPRTIHLIVRGETSEKEIYEVKYPEALEMTYGLMVGNKDRTPKLSELDQDWLYEKIQG